MRSRHRDFESTCIPALRHSPVIPCRDPRHSALLDRRRSCVDPPKRGHVRASDRVGSGLHGLERQGEAGGQGGHGRSGGSAPPIKQTMCQPAALCVVTVTRITESGEVHPDCPAAAGVREARAGCSAVEAAHRPARSDGKRRRSGQVVTVIAMTLPAGSRSRVMMPLPGVMPVANKRPALRRAFREPRRAGPYLILPSL